MSVMFDGINPNQGTRQYPNQHRGNLPANGYNGRMLDVPAITAEIRAVCAKRRWTQARLIEESGADQSTVQRIWNGNFKKISEGLIKVAKATGVELPSADATPLIIRPIAAASGKMQLWGTAEGGNGRLIFTGPIDLIDRPANLANVKDAFGVLVTGESMIPAFRPGDIAHLNPHLVPLPEDEIVLEREDRDGARYGIIKTFLGQRGGKLWRLRQYNPRRDFTRPVAEWPKCNVVVGRQLRRS